MNEPRRRFVTWALAFVLALAVLTVAYIALNPSITATGHSELYLDGISDTNRTDPEVLAAGDTATFTVGVSNYEHRDVSYRIVTAVNGTEITEDILRIRDGETQEITMTVRAPTEPGRYRVEFQLYYDDTESPELTTWYWIEVTE